jgi:hypothetical protein
MCDTFNRHVGETDFTVFIARHRPGLCMQETYWSGEVFHQCEYSFGEQEPYNNIPELPPNVISFAASVKD